jgi:hypothetical protein
MLWERSGNSLYATVRDPLGVVRYRLSAERGAFESWNWVVRHDGELIQGVADTEQNALQLSVLATR